MQVAPVDPLTTPDPPDPSDPPEEWLELLTLTQSLTARRDSSLRYLGTVSEAARALADLAGQSRSTVWNAQRLVSFYALRDGRHLTDAARRRGVTIRAVTRPLTLQVCPLWSSYGPDGRVGPVTSPLMILDSMNVILPGLDGESIWTSSDPHLAAIAVNAYQALWAASRPAVPQGEEPPLTARMVDIAFLLADGASDRQISTALEISERTVSAEVREIGRRLGTDNRAQTIARICGAPLLRSSNAPCDPTRP